MQPPRYLSDSEIAALLEDIRGKPMELAVRLALDLGCRRAEIPRLRWKDIDFERELVHIRGTKTAAADRFVPMFQGLKAFLEPRRSVPAAQVLAAAGEGMPILCSGLATQIRRHRENSALALTWSLQVLRRTYGALLLRFGYKLEQASRLLGHTSVLVTQRWYVHLTQEDLLASLPKGYSGVSSIQAPNSGRIIHVDRGVSHS